MKAILIPIVMALLGAGLGGGAALALRPEAPEDPDEAAHEDAAEEPAEAEPAAEDHGGHDHAAAAHEQAAPAPAAHGEAHGGEAGGHGAAPFADYYKISSQFVVPVIEGDRTRALVAISLSLDLGTGGRDAALNQEPRLRDALLRVMFDHANTGGFAAGYTGDHRLEPLRAALLEQARAILGPSLKDVLITDIARQET